MNSPAGLGERGEHISIMIPTYNCAVYLRDTLRSLRAEGDVLGAAQIRVLDDQSTRDDPEAVVKEMWDGRVEFHRHPSNVGPIANFNACLEQAERPWIHILHGDDFVLPGAYREFDRCLRRSDHTAAVYGRTVVGDEDGVWTAISSVLGPDDDGLLEYDPMQWATNPVNFAGALVSRSAVDRVGGFDDSFCHVADWNLWWRIAREVPVAYTNRCVAFYRHFPGNHSSTLRRDAINVKEWIEQLNRVAASLNGNGSHDPATIHRLYIRAYHRAKDQCAGYVDDADAFRANMRVLRRFPVTKWSAVASLWSRRYRRHLGTCVRRG